MKKTNTKFDFASIALLLLIGAALLAITFVVETAIIWLAVKFVCVVAGVTAPAWSVVAFYALMIDLCMAALYVVGFVIMAFVAVLLGR